MSDLIRRDDILKELNDSKYSWQDYDEMEYALNHVPSVDAVEIVRCKDCKWRGDYGCPMYHEEYVEWDDDGYHEWEVVEHDRTRDDGFCNLGEQRTDE